MKLYLSEATNYFMFGLEIEHEFREIAVWFGRYGLTFSWGEDR